MSEPMLRAVNAQMLRLQVDAADALLWVVSAPWYALGWLVGFGVRCVLWCVAALVAGYRAGRGT